MSDGPAEWKADPTGRHDHRYWDGSQWTDHVSDGGVASTDPYDAAAAPAPGDEDVTAVTGSWDDPTTTQPAAGDPTAAQPVAEDATAVWSTTPAPPGPPPPVPAYASPAEPESDGSRRGLIIGGGILAAVVVGVLAFLLLGGGDDGDTDVEPTAFGSDPELDALYTACEDGDFEACDELFLESPRGSEYEKFGDTCGERNEPAGYCVELYGEDSDGADEGDEGLSDSDIDVDFDGDMADMLADIYEESLGLEREKAECLADRLEDAISSGDMSEEQAMRDVFTFLEECDISMEELTN